MPIYPGLMSLLLLSTSFHGPSKVGVQHVSDWTLRVESDQFTGQVVCSLSRSRIDYRRQALIFHLSKTTDTASAVYRIDGGPPIWSRDDEAELAHQGFALHDDDLDNPSGGLVRVPARRATDARVVEIETASNHRTAKFRIDGLASALGAARKSGCVFEDPAQGHF